MFEPFEMVHAERREIAAGKVDDLGKPGQLDLLPLRQEIEIELLKEAVGERRLGWLCEMEYADAGGADALGASLVFQ